MTRQLYCLALILFAATLSQGIASAQQLSVGPNGVQYNSYGQGYYGGYGQSRGYYAPPRVRAYNNYGNGPYGYGRSYQFPSPGAGSAYQFPNNAYNNGYYTNGPYGQYYTPVYSPYGFSINTY